MIDCRVPEMGMGGKIGPSVFNELWEESARRGGEYANARSNECVGEPTRSFPKVLDSHLVRLTYERDVRMYV